MSEEETKVDLLTIKKQEIEKEIKNVKEIKNKIDEEAERLRKAILLLIKENKEKNLKSIENYEKNLKLELKLLDPNQIASNFNEILEKGQKVEEIISKERKEYQVKSFENFNSSIEKSMKQNFQIDEESKIDNSSSRILRKIKLEFQPIFLFFDIKPSDNFVNDISKLKEIVSEDKIFFDRVSKFIFNHYDKVIQS